MCQAADGFFKAAGTMTSTVIQFRGGLMAALKMPVRDDCNRVVLSCVLADGTKQELIYERMATPEDRVFGLKGDD